MDLIAASCHFVVSLAERSLGPQVRAPGCSSPCLPSRLAWDAYVDMEGDVHVIDVAPFHEATDPLLYSWPELWGRVRDAEAAGASSESRAPAELRLVEPGGVVPSAQIYYGLPHELQAAGTENGGTDLAQLLDAARRAANAAHDE